MTAEGLEMISANLESGFVSPIPGSSGSEIFSNCFNSMSSFSSCDMKHNNDSYHGMTPTNSEPLSMPVCAGCGKPIYDQYILRVAPDMEWHAECLKCCECGQLLDENETCYVKGGRIYCKRDYTKLFGTKCSKCQMNFSSRDFVMRARNKIYHVDCFRCSTCRRQLFPGEEFALNGDQLICSMNHDLSMESDIMETHIDHHISSFSPPHVNIHGGVLSPMKEIHTSARLGNHSRSNGSNQKRKDSKTTRVRTVLNEKQLHTLRSCYAANCRPDALMKEQLTEMTGLSARVIRVWFQNKRCKDKKRSLALKQIQDQQAKQRKIGKQNGNSNNSNLSPVNGVPMIVSEPVRNDSTNPQPVEVHNYQQPVWGALSELSLPSDLEQGAFQQLINHYSDQGQSSTSDTSDICSIPSVSSASIDMNVACSTPLTVDTSVYS